jgi:NADH-quinone oxidoreductase subunit N
MTVSKLMALAPILLLSLTIIVLVLHASLKRDHKSAWYISALGLMITLWGTHYASEYAQQVTVLIKVDQWGLLFTGLIVVSTLTTLAISRDVFLSEGNRKEEYYLLILLSTLGAIVLCQSSHIVSLLLGMELMGIAVYAMIAFPEDDALPLEASIKYLILSACASAMLLFGFALLYAATGDLSFAGIGSKVGSAYESNSMLVVAGTAMVLSGIGFKLSLVPFHMWTPDVYEGAPTPVTNFLATVSKGAMFVALTRLVLDGQFYQFPSLMFVLTLISVGSMLVGNLLALRQENVKRLLAYSSIAHFGYLLMVIIGFSSLKKTEEILGLGRDALTFYLAAYILSTLAAIVVVANVAKEKESHIEAFTGLFWKQPIQAATLMVAMLSFAGIPLTAGFMGKFYLITLGLDAGLWLLLSGLIIGSAIGIYYYLRLIFAMSSPLGDLPIPAKQSLSWRDALAFILLLSVLYMGSWPQPFIDFAGV